MEIIFKPDIYVFCDKYEFPCSRFSIITSILELILSLKDWPLVLSK